MKPSTKTATPPSAQKASRISFGTFSWCLLLIFSTSPFQIHSVSVIRTTTPLLWSAVLLGFAFIASLLCGLHMMLQRHLGFQPVFYRCSCILSVSLSVTRRSLMISLSRWRSSSRSCLTRRSLWLKHTLHKSSKWLAVQVSPGCSTLKQLVTQSYLKMTASNSKFLSWFVWSSWSTSSSSTTDSRPEEPSVRPTFSNTSFSCSWSSSSTTRTRSAPCLLEKRRSQKRIQ